MNSFLSKIPYKIFTVLKNFISTCFFLWAMAYHKKYSLLKYRLESLIFNRKQSKLHGWTKIHKIKRLKRIKKTKESIHKNHSIIIEFIIQEKLKLKKLIKIIFKDHNISILILLIKAVMIVKSWIFWMNMKLFIKKFSIHVFKKRSLSWVIMEIKPIQRKIPTLKFYI